MLTVFTGVTQLSLPVRIVDPNDDEPVSFGEPEAAAPIPAQQLQPAEHRWTVTRDLARDESALAVVKDLGVVHLDDIDLSVSRRAHETYTFTADDFSSVRGETPWVIGFERGSWSTRTVTRTVLTCTPEDFHVHAQLDAYEGEQRIAAKTWTRVIPRDLV